MSKSVINFENELNIVVANIINCIYFREFTDEFAVETIEKIKGFPIEDFECIDTSLAFNLFRLPYVVRKELISYINSGTKSLIFTDEQDIERIIYYSELLYSILLKKVNRESYSNISWNSDFR